METAQATQLQENINEIDPETMFLLLNKRQQTHLNGSDDDVDKSSTKTSGMEWELYKENVRPLKRGRNVQLLNHALTSQYSSTHHSLLQTRRRMIEAIDEYQGDDPLQPWIECIKWVQEAFPAGGESSGLIVIYEQCVRRFWHDERYKDDLRYLKVWMEYAANCADAQVIFSFLEANQIGQNHSIYYISYASHLESKNKLKKADEIYNLGIARKAEPLERLETAYRAFLLRVTQKKQESHEDDTTNHPLVNRSFGTMLKSEEASRQSTDNLDPSKRKVKLQRISTNKPLSVYNDSQSGPNHSMNVKHKPGSWHNLGNQSDRNKENSAIPCKWVSYKVPQKTVARAAVPSRTTSSIEVYVDEDCSELPATQVAKEKPSKSQLGLIESRNLKKETEMLKENPLRNFPVNCLR